MSGSNDIDQNDVISALLDLPKVKPVLVGIYFEPEIAKALDQLAKQGPRGTKSKIVNEAVKRLLLQREQSKKKNCEWDEKI